MRNDIYNLTVKEATEREALNRHKPDWDLWNLQIDDVEIHREITTIQLKLQQVGNLLRDIVYYHALASYTKRTGHDNDCKFYKRELRNSLESIKNEMWKTLSIIRGLQGIRELNSEAQS